MIILVGGRSGSGKTTASVAITNDFEKRGKKVIHVSLDDFYHKFDDIQDVEERAKVNFDHPDSIDVALLKEKVSALLKREICQLPMHDYDLHTRKSTMHEVDARDVDVIIFEGIFALNDKLGLIDLVLTHGEPLVTAYMDTDPAICALRRITRDLALGRSIETINKQYSEVVVPMQKAHVEPTMACASVVVQHDDIQQLLSCLEKPVEVDDAYFSKGPLYDMVGVETLVAAKTTVTGWYGSFASYATNKLEGWEKVIDKAADKVFGVEGGEAESSESAPKKQQ